jgi:hypothetical protein
LPTSAYKIRIRTDSADNNALILLDDGELVAILVELADESHGDACGQWIIESTFGLNPGGRPGPFGSADEAANWISQHICQRRFTLDGDVIQLG